MNFISCYWFGRRLAAWLLALCVMLPARPLLAQVVSSFSYASEPDDFIGKGASGFFPPDKITNLNIGQSGSHGAVFFFNVADRALGNVFCSLRFSRPTR